MKNLIRRRSISLPAWAVIVSLVLTIRHSTAQTVVPVPDESLTFQNNPQHDGNDPSSLLTPPLTLKWRQDFTSLGVQSVSYPLIAQGLVIVTTVASPPQFGSDFPKALVAFDAVTGLQKWSVTIHGTYGFANAAYDSNKVFVVSFDGMLQAFNAANGKQQWSVQLPNQYAFTSPPTAVTGVVFVSGAGDGGTLYAVDESNGNVLWTGSVENGDHSSPAVFPGHVFVSYSCPQVYDFMPSTGQLLWHYSGPCEGGGGKTPVVHAGKVYVRDSYFASENGLILNASNGTIAGSFASDPPPAFVDNLGLYLSNGTLTGVDVTNGQVLWSFAGDGGLVTAPLVVNQVIYVGSSSGLLYGLDLQGTVIWSNQVGASIQYPDEQNATLTTGLGAGENLLVVPAGATLSAYAGSTPPVTATPLISPGGGTFKKKVKVTLSCATSGATIYYTTDGTDPTTSSSVYVGSTRNKKSKGFIIKGRGDRTVKAIATAPGRSSSGIAVADFEID